MVKSLATLNADLDLLYPSTGIFGVAALLDDKLTSNLTFTATDLVNNIVTTSVAHRLVTGSRVQLSNSGGALPAPLVQNRDYFVIAVTANTLKFATTRASAATQIAVDITSAGSGVHSLTEQQLLAEDSLPVLINHELKPADMPDYVRRTIQNIGAAVNGEKPPVVWSQSVGLGNPALAYRHLLLIKAGVATPGNATGLRDHLFTESSEITIDPATSKLMSFILRLSNP